MTELTEDQAAKRASIEKSALIVGVIVGVIVGLVAFWALGSQGPGVRYGGSAGLALIVGALANRASFKSGAKSAVCASCGAAFAWSRTDRKEMLASSEPKESREDQDDGTIKVTTWTEETYDVEDTYGCNNCGDTEVKSYTTTRRRDEETTVERRKKSSADAVDEPVDEAAGEADAGGKKKSTEAPPAEGKKKSADDAEFEGADAEEGEGRKGRR